MTNQTWRSTNIEETRETNKQEETWGLTNSKLTNLRNVFHNQQTQESWGLMRKKVHGCKWLLDIFIYKQKNEHEKFMV